MVTQIKKGITYAESKEADAKVRALVEEMLENVATKGDNAVENILKNLTTGRQRVLDYRLNRLNRL
jgi:sulfopropanediol 3-dehydrogenase